MHELSLAIEILKNVLDYAESNNANRVNEVYLEMMSPTADSNINAENLQSYFDLVSKGTIAEGAELSIELDNKSDGEQPYKSNITDMASVTGLIEENDDFDLLENHSMLLKGMRIEKN